MLLRTSETADSGHYRDKKTVTSEAEASMLSDNAAILRSTQMRVRDVVLAIALCHNVRVPQVGVDFSCCLEFSM